MKSPLMTPSLKIVESCPFEDSEDVEDNWDPENFVCYDIDIVGTLKFDQETDLEFLPKTDRQQARAAIKRGELSIDVHIGDLVMFNVPLIDQSWEMAEYYSASLAFAVFPFMAEPLSEQWPWVNDALDRRLHKGGGWCAEAWILDYARLDPPWRGQGWGRWAMANAILDLIGEAGDAVIVLPGPLEIPGQPGSDPPSATWDGFADACTAIAGNLRRIGFRNFVKGYMLLDTGSPTAQTKLHRWANAKRIATKAA